MIRRIFLVILITLPTLALAQIKTELFNHKDLSGWYAFEPELGKMKNATDLFSVEQNMIRLYGKKAGYLMSEQSFTNFKLNVDFRWNTDSTFVRKSNKKNSGVMYLVPENTPDELWPKGFQFQIKEGATGDFILLKEVTLEINEKTIDPGASVVSPRYTDASKAIGEWNTLSVTVQNGTITQELNGVIVNKGINASITSGHILLQYEGFPIDFRKVEVIQE